MQIKDNLFFEEMKTCYNKMELKDCEYSNEFKQELFD